MFRALVAIGLMAATISSATAADDFKAFWSKFSTAMARNDRAVVKPLIKYPFYFNDKLVGDQEFDKIYAATFPKSARACLAKGKPHYSKDGNGNDSYSVSCGDEIFSFDNSTGAWKFESSGPND